MGLPKSRNAVGLGNSLMNDRFGKGKGADMRRGNFKPADGIVRKAENGETYITNNKKEAAWMKMRSVTEQGALDEFLSTAELAGTDFTAQKINSTQIIHTDQKNPFLLTPTEERKALRKQKLHRNQLIVPRRPKWDENTTAQELNELEKQSFMDWRRRLAYLQEGEDLLMTPFERNLEVWRQLWRVIERSDLVVQIVDGRNPLHFRSEDLEKYVKEIDSRKRNMLLINKADMLTDKQRIAWARYLTNQGINFRFFSAELAKRRNEEAKQQEGEEEEEEDSEEYVESDEDVDEDLKQGLRKVMQSNPASAVEAPLPEESEEKEKEEKQHQQPEPVQVTRTPKRDPDEPLTEEELIRIITTDELEELFLENAPDVEPSEDGSVTRKTQIGLVGYPNVGKSSTINALTGAKKVSVSATPGKTKHFQTIHLSDQVVLCDCPGLVFPNFATTKAELVCNGVLPIDQLREYQGPAGLVARRIPQPFVEAVYGISVRTRPVSDGGSGRATASELLRSFARARGFATTGLGQPDESRAARVVLKDYVRGRLPFVHPPPDEDAPIDDEDFNRDLYDVAHLPSNRRGGFEDESTTLSNAPHPTAAPTGGQNDGGADDTDADTLGSEPVEPAKAAAADSSSGNVKGSRADVLDKDFFEQQSGVKGQLNRPFHNPYTVVGSVEAARKQEQTLQNGKKHFKAGRRKKATKAANSFMQD